MLALPRFLKSMAIDFTGVHAIVEDLPSTGTYVRFGIVSVPAGWGGIPNGVHAPLFYPSVARCSYRYTKAGSFFRMPWVPIVMDGQIVRRGPSLSGWVRTLDVVVEPGCVVNREDLVLP